MAKSSIKFIVLSVIVLGLAATSFGQGGATGAISGMVQDPSGAVVANADVAITNQETNVLERSVTDRAGWFVYRAPVAGGNLHRDHPCGGVCGGEVFADLVVRVTETTRMTAKLVAQSVQQKIEVQAEIQSCRHERRDHRSGDREQYDPVAAAGDAELPAVADALERRAKRTECRRTLGARRCTHSGERAARRQQQLSDRRRQRDGLQRGGADEHAAAESGCGAAVQGADFAL